MQIPGEIVYAVVCLVIYLPISFFVIRYLVKNKIEDSFIENIIIGCLASILFTAAWPAILTFIILALPHYLIGKFYDK